MSYSLTMSQDFHDKTHAKCDACDEVYPLDELADIYDPANRMCPGEETPAGECPDKECGAFCYLVDNA